MGGAPSAYAPPPSSQQINFPQPSGEPSHSCVPWSLLGSLSLPPLMTGHNESLRMHLVYLTSSLSTAITSSTSRHSGRCDDGSPYTLQEKEIMEKVDKMLAASRALMPEAGTSSKGAAGFLKKLRFSLPQLFAELQLRAPIKPHPIWNTAGGIEPFPLPGQARHIPSV
ncbi:hypothetical protein VTH06DRAFT_2297 [Thermothelomyces fergusii]